jgi:hypothetical protein
MVVISDNADEDNRANRPGDLSGRDFLALKTGLRTLPKATRNGLRLKAADLAHGYDAMMAGAPRRPHAYLSTTRTGKTGAEPTGLRKEERLAMAWFNAGVLKIAGSTPVGLLDYQFPLKAVRTDVGIGKIDLLGYCAADDALVVVELKVAGNTEDRRIGLIESLIYAAIVEANAVAILREVEAAKGHRIENVRPKILLAAPSEFWSAGYPSCEALRLLAGETARLLDMDIRLLAFNEDAASLGLDGSRPMMAGGVSLSPLMVDDAPC